MYKQLNSNNGQTMPYLVEITETHVRTVVIYAHSPIDSEISAESLCRNGNLVVSNGNDPIERHCECQGIPAQKDLHCYACFDADGTSHCSNATSEDPWSRAIRLISNFYWDSYRERITKDAFANLSAVPIAATDYEDNVDEPLQVQVYADLLNFAIVTFINGIQVSKSQSSSLEAFCNEHLEFLVFDDLVYIEDKEHDAYRAAKAERKGS